MSHMQELADKLNADEIAHNDQLEVWADEMQFAILEWLKEPETYDDKVRLAHAIKDEIKKVVEIALERVRCAINERRGSAPMTTIDELLTILTDSAAQTDRASPVMNGVTPDNWLPPGEAWFASFLECVQRQIAATEDRGR